MPVVPIEKTVILKISCPTIGCKTRHRVDHLLKDLQPGARQSFPSWSCKHCHLQITAGEVWYDADGNPQADVTWGHIPPEERDMPGLIILRSTNAGEKDPIYAVIEVERLNEQMSRKELHDDWRYYYDEHTCPTNWTRHIVALVHDQDSDPHGVFCLHRIFRASEIKQLTGFDLDEFDQNKHEMIVRMIPEAFGLNPNVSFPRIEVPSDE